MAGIGSARIWNTVKPHIPLIKFRKGGLEQARATSGPAIASVASKPSPKSTQKSPNITSVILEDYQLPPRFRRLPLDEKEVAYINRGGPE